MGTHCLMGTKFQFCQMKSSWDSLAVQWLGLCASTAGGMGLIPGQGTEILQATQHGQKQKKKKEEEFWRWMVHNNVNVHYTAGLYT